jgi:hypothetical protein
MTAKPPKIPAAYIAARMTPQPDPARLAALLGEFKPALCEAVQEANGRADSFTFSASDIVSLALSAERKLADGGVPKAFRAGAILHATSAGPASKSYKYVATGTAATLNRTSTGAWIATRIERATVWPGQPQRQTLHVNPAAAEAIRKKAMEGFAELAPAAALAA